MFFHILVNFFQKTYILYSMLISMKKIITLITITEKENDMERYKPLYGSRWEYFLSEMSQKRRRAEQRILNNVNPLLVHLIAIDQFGRKDVNYKHHMDEVNGYKNIILKANQVKSTNKMYFSYEFINGIAHDEMTEAMHNFKRKFKVESKKEYIDLNDFSWFSLYNKK